MKKKKQKTIYKKAKTKESKHKKLIHNYIKGKPTSIEALVNYVFKR